MTSKKLLISCAGILLFIGNAQPQVDAKHFAKDGVSFDYANGWTISDESTPDAQQLTLGRADSDAQIRIFVHRGKVETPEKFAQARRSFIDPYVKSVNDTFVGMGAKPESTPATAQIGNVSAEGVRLRASLSGEPGEATILWLTLANRVLVLTFFGPDAALKKASANWDMVRATIKVVDSTLRPK
jgi:hypothetical protein